MKPEDLYFFVRESNRIEGIHRDPTEAELDAHLELLNTHRRLVTADLMGFVAVVAPGKLLRTKPTMNVRVGSHIAPSGGPHIRSLLGDILDRASQGEHPYTVHVSYETLHPFMDGNGRSGRALWLWQMLNQHEAYRALTMGFLHLFYYQALEHAGGRA